MKPLAPALIAGAISALLYITVFTFGLGFLFLFLPTLPIFWLGLGKKSPLAIHASLIAALLLTFATGPVSAIFLYLLCLGLPAWYISHEGLRHGSNKKGVIVWFPLTVVFAQLMAAFSFILLGVSLYYSRVDGGLPALIAPRINMAFSMLSSEFDAKTSEALQAAAPGLAFLVFAVSAWMWGLCLYLHGWVVNRELIRQKIAVRTDMHIDPFPPPNWMISLILIAAIALLVGSPALAFWGKASLLILLFPYFLLGMGLAHERTKGMEYRTLILFLLYFLMAMLLWPVLLMSSYGLLYHLMLLNKYLSGSGTSSRS